MVTVHFVFVSNCGGAASEVSDTPVVVAVISAALGFFLLRATALSTSPGSEVQRPLATVVIGGLVTSTLLTLFVLPLLYRALGLWREKREAASSHTAVSR